MKIYKYRNDAGYCCHRGHCRGDKMRCVENGCYFVTDCVVDDSHPKDKANLGGKDE